MFFTVGFHSVVSKIIFTNICKTVVVEETVSIYSGLCKENNQVETMTSLARHGHVCL